MMIRFLLLLFAACASTTRGPYLFPRGKQKHEITVISNDGKESFRANSFLILTDNSAKITALTPVALTLLKMEMQKGAAPHLTYVTPALGSQRGNIEILLKRLGHLLWLRGTPPSEIKVIKFAPDLSAEVLEWSMAHQTIQIKVERL